jgi:CubicO group peptidase (beta-lactamase class C family)
MPIDIQGVCDERFLPLQDAFRENFEKGYEIGASLAVTRHGRPVVDLWAGHIDKQRTRPWEKDTIAPVASTTKIALTLSFLMLVDRGLVDLDATIAKYWSEFAAGGKAHVTVREALTHSAGVPGFDPPVPLEAMLDWDRITAHIAAETHWFDGRRVVF